MKSCRGESFGEIVDPGILVESLDFLCGNTISSEVDSMSSLKLARLRHWLWLFAVFACAQRPGDAFATQFIQAHKVFLSDGYKENGTDAVNAFAVSYCKNPYVRDCQATFTGETWNNAYSSWYWNGILTYRSGDSQQIASTPIAGPITYSCIHGWSAYDVANKSGLCSRPDKPEVPCPGCPDAKNAKQAPQVGNPISVNGGLKVQVEQDYRNATGTLVFTRTYRADEGRWLHNHQVSGIDFRLAAPACGLSLPAIRG